ncbi:MAG TPA: hypothetical protein PKD26_15265 [Pyrinomonadaceae bacterium]|nr:hypothetical protein [Pyrinomonadaceae bacterium]
MNNNDARIADLAEKLPSPGSALAFFEQFAERNPPQAARLRRNEALLSDVLAIAAFSPLLATTMVQNPDYVNWLSRKRSDQAVRNKEELLESLARFSLTNSQLDTSVLFARFRRRELLRIFLRDVRRLATIAEITEEISNLADAILENALRIARQEMDNRYGAPFEIDGKGKKQPSDMVIVSLGKLGSRELNYSSDIDLLFIYSSDGTTTGTGSKGSVTNREYFSKLAETTARLVGKPGGEGAAYRVDLRLRPGGRVGALALSLAETIRYYLTEARSWEQQVLIRSRASAGSEAIFREFFTKVEDTVFHAARNAREALDEVFRSKKKIDHERRTDRSFDVKLGRGGIREIEFLAQALQLAHGGTDRWLRAPHTLISLSRLADRGLLTTNELSGLSSAYDLLRRLEHILQMEHGLQTHSLPTSAEKLALLAAKMGFADAEEFRAALESHTSNVSRAFQRVFGSEADGEAGDQGGGAGSSADLIDPAAAAAESGPAAAENKHRVPGGQNEAPAVTAIADTGREEILRRISETSPNFSRMIAAMPKLAATLKIPGSDIAARDYRAELLSGVNAEQELPLVLSSMRGVWSELIVEIAVAELCDVLSTSDSRRLQTELAEASIDAALRAAAFHTGKRDNGDDTLPVILAMGKLGSGTLDYGSDLDIVAAYTGEPASAERYARLVEMFVTLLSGMTREGNLYRVDLRLRPYGRNGPLVTSVAAFDEYIRKSATIWELLAYIQMRAVAGRANADATAAENALRAAIAERVAGEDPEFIRSEAFSMRLRLEEAHGRPRAKNEVNIKFGAGGLLDVYFAVRYLQLVHPAAVPDDARSTTARLDAVFRSGVLSAADHSALAAGHAFLSTLDHTIRLVSGRSSRITPANRAMIELYARRMAAASPANLFEQLAVHRLAIREAFENIFRP